MYTLVLDTSTKLLYVAVLKNKEEIANKTRIAKKDHASYIPSYVEEVIKKSGIKPKDITKVIIGSGLGSYTGLRVSGSFAKVFAYSLNIKLYSVSSLFLLSSGETKPHIAYSDARRNRLYLAGYSKENVIIKDGIYDSNILNDEKVNGLIHINLDDEKTLKKLKPFNYKVVFKNLVEENYFDYEPRYK